MIGQNSPIGGAEGIGNALAVAVSLLGALADCGDRACVGGNSIFYLQNTSSTAVDEFSPLALNQLGSDFLASHHIVEVQETFSYIDSLPAIGGGYTGGHCFPIYPIQDQYLSNFALHYLVLFLLSSLVRYRPQTWMHAISGTSVANMPADDRALSLIEHLLTTSSHVIPQMILTMFNPQEDQYFAQESAD